MQLPIQMPGLGHVNMYCLLDERRRGGDRPGIAGRGELGGDRRSLARRRTCASRDVHTVIVTHSHPDHFGGAARFAAETGCKVIAHATFRVFGRTSVCRTSTSRSSTWKTTAWRTRAAPVHARSTAPTTCRRGCCDAERAPAHAVGRRAAAPRPAQLERWRADAGSGHRASAAAHAHRRARLGHPAGARASSTSGTRPATRAITSACTIRTKASSSRAITCCRRSRRTSPASAASSDPLQAFYDSLDSVAADRRRHALLARARPSVRRPARARRRDQAPPRRAPGEVQGDRQAPRRGDRARLLARAVSAAQLGHDGRERDLRAPRASAPARPSRCHARDDGWLVYVTDAPSA